MTREKTRVSRKRVHATPERAKEAGTNEEQQYAGAFTRVRLVRAWIAVIAALVAALSGYMALLERIERWWTSSFDGRRVPRRAAVLAVSYLLGVLALLVPGRAEANPAHGGGTPSRSMPSVSLSHDGNGTASVNTNASSSTTFTLTNITSGTLTVNLSITTCDGALSSGSCTRSPTSVNLASGASTTITTGFTGGTSSGTGTLTLTAKNTSGTTLASASVTVTVLGIATVSDAPHLGDRRDVGMCIADCFESTFGYTTPTYYSLDVPRSVTLLYRSGRAYPQGKLALDVTDANAPAGSSFRLKLKDSAGTYLAFPNGSTELWFARAASGPTRLAAEFNATAIPTSARLYSAEVTPSYPATGLQGTTVKSVRIIVVNGQSSVFGAGVELAGLQRVFTTQGGVLVTEGSGSAAFFSGSCTPAASCSFTSPAGEFSTLSTGSNRYQRTYPDGSVVTFDAAGKQLSVKSRFGDSTTVTWGVNAASVAVPTRFTDPVGQFIDFTYRGVSAPYQTGSLGLITVPSNRVAQFGILGAGNLEHLVEVDGQWYGVASYDAQRRMTSFRNRAMDSTLYAYRYGATLDYADGPRITVYGGSTVRPRATVRNAADALLNGAASGGGTSASPLAVATDLRAILIGPRNDSTLLSLNRFGAPQKSYAPLTPSDSAEYNATTGQVTRTISPTGMDVRYTWSAEKLVKVQNVTLNTQDSIEYETQYSLPKHVISSTSAEQWFSYDQTRTGWPLQTTRIGVSTATPTTHYVDAKGRDTTVVDPAGHSTKRYYAAGGLQNSDSVRAPNLQVTRFSRDALGRVVSTRAPNGVRDSTYLDALNRPVWVAGPLVNDTTRFQYDAMSNVTSVTDATGQVYGYQRNALGWVTKLTHPGTLGSDSTKYDVAGNPVWVRTRAGRQVVLDYDVLGRVTKKRSLTSNDSITFAYDPAGRWVAAKMVVAGSTVVSTDTIFTDSLGRTIKERTNRPGVTYWDVSSVWGTTQRGGVSVNKSGNYWTEHTVTFMPDVQMRPSYISVPNYSGSTRLTYNADQLRDTIVFPTGLRENWGYTPDHALAKREYSIPAVRDAFDRTYRTDSLDRLVQRGIGTAGKFQTFDYDVDGRLAYWIKKHQTGTPTCVNVSGGWGYDCNVGGVATDATVTATYDNVENPADLSPTVDPGNRLRAFNGVAMTYDADGNLVKRVGATTDSLEWDDFGQLKRVLRSGTVIASFDYDGFGRRIRKTTSTTGTTTYVWDGDQIILEADSVGAMLRGYSYYPGTDRPHTVSTPSNAYLMSIEPATGDVNGLIRASDNAVVAQYAYTPWGELEVDSTNIRNSLRWKGLVYDRETGLYYVRARYYDPKVRRFISEDPIGIAGGINEFAFAGGDPVNGDDPAGLSPMCWHLETAHIGGQFAGAQVFEHECSPGILGAWTSGILSGGFGQGSQGGMQQGPSGQTTGSGMPSCPVCNEKGIESAGLGPLELLPLFGLRRQGGKLLARELGAAGEAASGIIKNWKRIPSLTGTAPYRIPDGLTETLLSEVKNVAKLNLTNQIRDFAAYAAQTGRTFEIYVRASTQFSGPLQQFIKDNYIVIRTLRP